MLAEDINRAPANGMSFDCCPYRLDDNKGMKNGDHPGSQNK